MNIRDNTPNSPLHESGLHESGYRHTTGEAIYVDDMPEPKNMLVGMVMTSTEAHARILARDATKARALSGIKAVLFADDVPGDNLIGPIIHDEPLLAEEEVHYVGQPIALVLGEDEASCREAIAQIEVEYEPLEAIFNIEQAIANESFLTDPHRICRGDVQKALDEAVERVSGQTRNGFQDHFYLETHVSLAIPEENHSYRIYSSSQHPTEVQKLVAHILGGGHHEVICEVPRMGGAFGGKESQASVFACLAALGAHATGRPVKVWLNRDEDMIITGKRHPFWSRYEAAFDEDGILTGMRVEIYCNGGWSIDLSGPILDRALFHIDNAYYIANLDFVGRACRTNLPSNTAFRGFGGPQGMLVVEEAINRYAERMGLDPAEIRQRNFYGEAPRDKAPYGQEISHNRLQRIWDELMESSDYQARRKEIDAFNQGSRYLKRGIAFQPVKFGISFTKAILNQAGALVHVYVDGTVQLNHGGTEMGQGLHTKMLTICAHELGVKKEQIRVMNTATDKVPNTSATAASSGSDLNGQAVKEACQLLRERMRPIAAMLLGVSQDHASEIHFEGGRLSAPSSERPFVTFADLAQACWMNRVSLSATGFYRTPGVAYDHATGSGTPFFYFAYGGAICELEVSGLTGEHRVHRVDILHDVGTSLVPSIDIGQVEGAFVQGLGWLTAEEILYHPDGWPITTGPSTYKIPAIGDIPLDFHVKLLERAPQDGVIHGSKAVGEPPFMLAISVVSALRHAVSSFGKGDQEVVLKPPCTPEAILRAIEAQKDVSE